MRGGRRASQPGTVVGRSGQLLRDVSLRGIGRRVFGDRLGLVVFLTAFVVYLSYWRIGILITDTYTVANTLVGVSEGQLHVESAVYGPGLDTPGMGTRDGRYYGRNYGQVFLALPFLWTIEAVSAVADLRVALAALWALTLLGLARLVGAERDRPALGTSVGCGLALLVFAGVVADATTVDAAQHHLIALQLQTMVAAALVGVGCYRLFTRAYSRRVGLAGGLAASLATPIGFWAQFPKRHVLVAVCVVATMYLLYRSREGEVGVDVRFRAAAYLPVGLAAWVSGAEGLILLVALLAVDVPTGGRDLRSLATAGVTCLLGVVPMFVTNLFVTGNLAEPPRTLTAGGSGSLEARGREVTGGSSEPESSGGTETSTPQPTETSTPQPTETGTPQATETASSTTTESAGGPPSSQSDAGGPTESLGEFFDTLVGGFDVLYGLVGRGYGTALTDLERLYPTFVRGGYIPAVAQQDAGEAIRLAFLEAMPLAAALLAVPVVVARSDVRGRVSSLLEGPRLSALGTVDAFAVVYTVVLTLVYLPRLPVHAAITVRYLLPLFPLALYGLCRLPAVRRVLEERLQFCAVTYLGAVLVGGQVLVVYLWATDAARGEAVQTHAMIGLATAALLAGWALADAGGHRNDRLGAVALGLAAASGTTFLVLAALWHFAFVGARALPLL